MKEIKYTKACQRLLLVNAVTSKVRLMKISAKGNSRIFLYFAGRFIDSTLGGFFLRPLQYNFILCLCQLLSFHFISKPDPSE